MFSLNQNSWVTRRESSADERDRMHRIAIREARLATDDRVSVAETARERFASRRIAPAPAATGCNELSACCD